MTQPTTIYFGPDGGKDGATKKKVFLRTLLYSTSYKGKMVESMHVNVQRGEMKQNFNIWVYGEDKLARGSGLFIGKEGKTFNHHFLDPMDLSEYSFLDGNYILRVYAQLVGSKKIIELSEIKLKITDEEAERLQQYGAGIYFDWLPDQQEYSSHIDSPPVSLRIFGGC